MSDLEQALGVDRRDSVQDLAVRLTEADAALVRDLVALRKTAELTQDEVAKRMGRSQSVVSDIESMENDPRLSTLRRYALAIGAMVNHAVSPYGEAPTPVFLVERTGAVAVDLQSIFLRSSVDQSGADPEWTGFGRAAAEIADEGTSVKR